jgi:hypothetical protein
MREEVKRDLSDLHLRPTRSLFFLICAAICNCSACRSTGMNVVMVYGLWFMVLVASNRKRIFGLAV